METVTPKKIAVLGSTGSIGRSALEVVELFPDRFAITALTAASSAQLLAEQALKHKPAILAVADQQSALKLKSLLSDVWGGQILWGEAGYVTAACQSGADLVLSAMVGVAGLKPTLAALEAGLDVALANKEVLAAAGELVMAKVKNNALLPVDSEHSAIFQALMGQDQSCIHKLMLTASGGPFRDWPPDRLKQATARQTLAHPNWSMGPKITVDSATMMNKGLEALEASWLFGQPLSKIEVVVHPQSIVHSMVEFNDGSIMAQMAPPDMRLPIAFALNYPQRLAGGWPRLDLLQCRTLTFEEPDLERFPALKLAYEAGRAGGLQPAVLNAANEEAVAAFLAGEHGFTDIASLVAAVLDQHVNQPLTGLDDILEADAWARRQARARLKKRR